MFNELTGKAHEPSTFKNLFVPKSAISGPGTKPCTPFVVTPSPKVKTEPVIVAVSIVPLTTVTSKPSPPTIETILLSVILAVPESPCKVQLLVDVTASANCEISI